MFLTTEDYTVVIGEQALRVFSQISTDNLHNAECEAIEEISSYLRPKYATSAIFSATGEQRNRLMVMYCVDVALYHLSASMPQKMGSEVRKERYERAIKWLEGVAKGQIVPNLPIEGRGGEGSSEQAGYSGLTYGTQPPLHHSW